VFSKNKHSNATRNITKSPNITKYHQNLYSLQEKALDKSLPSSACYIVWGNYKY